MPSIQPDFGGFTRLSADATVVPVMREVLGDAITPVVAYSSVGQQQGSFLLESVVGGEKWARYSFVGFDPDVIVRAIGDRFERVTARGVESSTVSDPWQTLRELLASYKAPELAGMPRFWGGAVGYVSYDAVRRFEPTIGSTAPVEGQYDFCFSIGGTLLIFDNLRQTIRVVVLARITDRSQLREIYDAACARIDAALLKLKAPAALRDIEPPTPGADVVLPQSTFDRASYGAVIEAAKEHIRAGDIFQVVLSQRFTVESPVDPFDVYRTMRSINPSPYMFFLRFPGVRIAGASPETHVRVEGGVAELRPIAGTRRRGKTPAEDMAVEREMLQDPKEIAEHVMLVDLGRNDLGRISQPGTVKITERMAVERYSHVMHIVSNVSGKLAAGRDALDVLRATFPAGTLSGAPKVRAMQIIEASEPERRGIYGGAVGYIGFDGNMDLAIAIRTVVERDGVYQVQAGAGIVEASDPNLEYDESVNKASAALSAIAAAGRTS